MRRLVLIVNNVRSANNVGAILRSAEGFGATVYLTGYTPYPLKPHDQRLPHVATGAQRKITKTSLGAENTVRWFNEPDVSKIIKRLKSKGYTVAALEQTTDAQTLTEFRPPEQVALVVGNEISGLEPSILKLCDLALYIPMFGQKESFNVSAAAAIGLYALKFAKPAKKP